jgi:hypothetical protein
MVLRCFMSSIEPLGGKVTMSTNKKRCMFMIDRDQLEQMRSFQRSSGVSVPEQIRLGVQIWLASREWPVRRRPRRLASRKGDASIVTEAATS